MFAAHMACGDEVTAAAALMVAREARMPRREAEECALMLVLHAGFPAALEGLRILNLAWPGRARRTREGSPRQWRARGEALCRRVYGPAYAKLVPAVRTLHPDMAVWMQETGYGRVLSRAGLGGVERELVAVAVLGVGAWERQLVSHVLGARRVGATPAAVEAVLVIAAEAGDARARAVIRRTLERARRALPERA